MTDQFIENIIWYSVPVGKLIVSSTKLKFATKPYDFCVAFI